MKKTIAGIAGVIVLAFVIILFVNAGENTPPGKKVQTEVNGGMADKPCMMQCNHSTANKIQKCDPANCKGTMCDTISCKGKVCDPTSCPGHGN